MNVRYGVLFITIIFSACSSSDRNLPPKASELYVSGTLVVGNTVTGNYSYSDKEGDLEGESLFVWLRNGNVISDSAHTSYVIQDEDVGSLISFGVTPISVSGTIDGDLVTSAGLMAKTNSPPTFSEFKVSPVPPNFQPFAEEQDQIEVGFLVSELVIDMDPTFKNDSISINGNKVDHSEAAHVKLAEGENIIEVVLSSPTSTANRVYKLRAIRQGVESLKYDSFIKASESIELLHFASMIATSGDNVAVSSSHGRVYLYSYRDFKWQHEHTLVSLRSDDSYGQNIALDGNFLAVNSSERNCVYLLQQKGGSWFEVDCVTGHNTKAGNGFGRSLSLSGGRLVVGAPKESGSGRGINPIQGDLGADRPDSGAAYLFTQSEGQWKEEAYIKASNADAFDYFGGTVVLNDTTLAITAAREASSGTGVNPPGMESDNSEPARGAVYTYRNINGQWIQEAYIKAINDRGAAGLEFFGDGFGSTLALSKDTLVVGAYLDTSSDNGVNPFSMGEDDSQLASGAVHIYHRHEGRWSIEAFIKPPITGGNQFGYSLAINADILAVGADHESLRSVDSGIPSINGSGAVYLYSRTQGEWSQSAQVLSPNPDNDDNFGGSVGLISDALLVGSVYESSELQGIHVGDVPEDNNVSSSGVMFVFTSLEQEKK